MREHIPYRSPGAWARSLLQQAEWPAQFRTS
jgi:hypothetical protein